MRFDSKKTLDERKPEYALLPVEDYLLKIIKVEEKTQEKYQSTEQEDVIDVQLEVISYRDGETAFDAERKPSKGRKLFFTGRPDSMGFQRDGTASKTRALVAYATGQDILGEIELEAWEQLLGHEINAEVIQKPNQKGVIQNRIARFIAPKGQRPVPIAIANEYDSIPVVEDSQYKGMFPDKE